MIESQIKAFKEIKQNESRKKASLQRRIETKRRMDDIIELEFLKKQIGEIYE